MSCVRMLFCYGRATRRPYTSIQSTRDDAGVLPPGASSVQPISSTLPRSGLSTHAPSTMVSMSIRRQRIPAIANSLWSSPRTGLPRSRSRTTCRCASLSVSRKVRNPVCLVRQRTFASPVRSTNASLLRSAIAQFAGHDPSQMYTGRPWAYRDDFSGRRLCRGRTAQQQCRVGHVLLGHRRDRGDFLPVFAEKQGRPIVLGRLRPCSSTSRNGAAGRSENPGNYGRF